VARMMIPLVPMRVMMKALTETRRSPKTTETRTFLDSSWAESLPSLQTNRQLKRWRTKVEVYEKSNFCIYFFLAHRICICDRGFAADSIKANLLTEVQPELSPNPFMKPPTCIFLLR
jgi:hypothetical protein